MRRRNLLGGAAALLSTPKVLALTAAPQVVIIGGGFGGASCARALKKACAQIAVTVIEPNNVFNACPRSNSVIAGLREMSGQRFSYGALRADGITVVPAAAIAVDASARTVELSSGSRVRYDRLVMAPGIDLRWDALPGYDEAAAQVMPHAWQAGPQTELLRAQLQSMDDGGLVVIAAPAGPYRCPPGTYERASLIAHYLKRSKPRSKVLILDAKDTFPKQRLFEKAWQEFYPGMIEWVPLSRGGAVVSVEPGDRALNTDFERHRAAVANVIPPQQAGAIASRAGVADHSGWCPIDPMTFESKLQPNVHIIGDAAFAGAMPKSAFGANAQARSCAAAIAALLVGRPPAPPKLSNTCYTLAAPEYGFSIAGEYQSDGDQFVEVPQSGDTSPLDAPRSVRVQEASFAESWFRAITTETFG